MSYICTKKLSLGGVEYRPGDAIPDDAFVGDRARKLKAFGYITEAGGETAGLAAPLIELSEGEVPVISVVFAEGDEYAAYPVNTEQLQVIADTMQKNAGDAASAIEEIGDESVLAFIAKVDSRKTVKDAAQKRLAALSVPGQ